MIDHVIQNTGQYDILIVDDTVESLKLLGRILVERGYRVRPAPNGRLALKSVSSRLPDLILLDVKMPEMDGYEVCRRLKSDEYSRDVPVIFISAHGETKKKVEGFKVGGVDYITKPFEREEVLARVEIQLRLHELTERLEQRVEERTRQLQQEILAREQAQEHLRENEKRYSEIVEGTDNLITEVDARGRFIFVNETSQKILGLPPDQCIGRLAFEFVHPDDREITESSFVQWIKDRRSSVTFENRQMSLSGKVTDMHWTINLHFDNDGNVASVRSIARDVTEQKMAQAELSREAEINLAAAELSRRLLSPASIDDISLLVLEHAKLLTGSAFGFVGYVEPETGYLFVPTLTKGIWETCEVAGKDIVFKEFTGLWGWVLENRNSLMTNAATRDPRSSGTPPGHIPIHRFLSAPAVIGETLVGQVAVANSEDDYAGRDLQVIERLADLYAIAIQRQRTEQELERHRDRLEEMVKERTAEYAEAKEQAIAAQLMAEAANQSKSDFLARMSHEIRTPLNAVTGLTNIVLKTELTVEQRDYLNKVQIASNNLLEVISDILDFSKVEAGHVEMAHAPFDLDQVMEQLADLFSNRAAQKDVELVFTMALDVPRQVAGDAGRLTQVLTNLVENAVKFTETGEIVVGVKTEDGGQETNGTRQKLLFEVSDTGMGIAADELSTLFEPFTQADSYLTREHEGAGLGLAICRRLVELMGGRIWAESNPGRGSTFSFTVMVTAQKGEKLRLSSPTELHGLNTLVVDDSESSRQVLTDLLESFGFNVAAVDCGEDAIAELQREVYRLVLLDWKMPGMDGIETARRIRELEHQEPNTRSQSRIPAAQTGKGQIPIIILVTAYGREMVQERIDAPTVDAMLLKPVKASHLFNTIVTLFGKKEAVVVGQMRKPPTGPLHRLAGRRALVVEDSESNRDVAVALLKDAGLAVEVAENGRMAVAKVKESPRGYYDAVLMDIQMPVMDGYKATKEIREFEQQQDETAGQAVKDPAQRGGVTKTPIIALTAHALKGEKEKCLAADMDDYLAKPLDEQELHRVLLKWIAPRNGR